MSQPTPTTTTIPQPGSIDEKIQKSKQKTAQGGSAGGEVPSSQTDIVSPGAPGGVTVSKVPPKVNADGTRSFYMPNDDANFILSTMNPKQRDDALKILYERGQYGGAQRGNGLNNQDVAAFADLLYFSNALGKPWDQSLVEYKKTFPVKSTIVPGSGRRAPIQVSNTDDIKKVFKNAAQQLLGRAVDEKIADSFVSMIQAQERARQEQYQMQSGGVVQQSPDVGTLATKQIEEKFALEQRVQSAANAAGIIDNLVKGLAR